MMKGSTCFSKEFSHIIQQKVSGADRMNVVHVPVLVEEVLEFFKHIEGVFLDCTVGLGGHAEAILSKIPNSVVVGLDVDEEALDLAKRGSSDSYSRGVSNCSRVHTWMQQRF